MGEHPTVDEFQRHLQTELDKCEEISDSIERERRRLQVESAIQEAIAFRYRWKELEQAGEDPVELEKAVRLIATSDTIQRKSAQGGGTACTYCEEPLEGDMEFCVSCGKFQ